MPVSPLRKSYMFYNRAFWILFAVGGFFSLVRFLEDSSLWSIVFVLFFISFALLKLAEDFKRKKDARAAKGPSVKKDLLEGIGKPAERK